MRSSPGLGSASHQPRSATAAIAVCAIQHAGRPPYGPRPRRTAFKRPERIQRIAGLLGFRGYPREEAVMARSVARKEAGPGGRLRPRVQEPGRRGQDLHRRADGSLLRGQGTSREVGWSKKRPEFQRMGRRQARALRHDRLLEVRPPQPGHVPSRSPHGGGRGPPDSARSRHGRHRHEDLRTHGGHRQDRAGQLPRALDLGQARGRQAGAHPLRQRSLRLPQRRRRQARDSGGQGRDRPAHLPPVRSRRAGFTLHRLAVDRRGSPSGPDRQTVAPGPGASHHRARVLQRRLELRPDQEGIDGRRIEGLRAAERTPG